MTRHFLLFILATLFAAVGTSAFADTPLTPNVTTPLASLSGNNYVSNYYVDVTSATQQLNINVTATGGDIDLFVRFGTPFPTQDANATYPTISEDMLNRFAHYHSLSSTSNETVIVLPSSRIPLKAGRWYITVLNSSSSTASSVNLIAKTFATPQYADISIDFNSASTDSSDATNNCEIAPWTDSTAVTPVGNNPATTLGEQRRNALTYAVQQLSTQIQIPVPITVHACWAHLGGDSNSAILAHASPNTFLFDEPAFPLPSLTKKYTWYAITEAVRLGGTTQCGLGGGPCGGVDNEEIEAVFNEDIGSASVIGGEKFYFGYNPQLGGAGLDFVSIATHELTHGLGFLGLANIDDTAGPLGARAGLAKNADGSATIAYQNIDDGPYDDIYDDNVAIVNADNTYSPFYSYEIHTQSGSPGDAARAAALVSGPGPGSNSSPTGLRWSEATAVNSSANFLNGQAAPTSFPSLYAPCDESKTTICAAVPGSTLSHTVQAGDLMNAYYPSTAPRTLGLALPMLGPMGWSNTAVSEPIFTKPLPSNWYDRTHSGQGIDFRVIGHDAVLGDLYYLMFYTYKQDGTPEWYAAQGHLVDGVFVPQLDQNGNTLSRFIYHANQTPRSTLDSGSPATVIVDFNQASTSPACRNVDRRDGNGNLPLLAVMSWNFYDPSSGNTTESGNWCIEPLVNADQHGSPDYNGVWYAGSNDSRWGIVMLYVNRGAVNQLVAELYYSDANGQPLWAYANADAFANDVAIPLTQNMAGFCRECTPKPRDFESVGTITLHLSQATNEGNAPSGVNTVSINANYPGGGGFFRTKAPITMLSVPNGQ